MPLLTLNQAAKESKRAKSTILEAIRTGRLSAKQNDTGQWQIDPAELFRVYPADQSGTGTENRDRPPPEPPQNHLELLEILDRERKLLLAQIDDLKADRDHWRQQATALLTHQAMTPAQDQAQLKADRSESALFKRIFRGWRQD
jgi:hypothetical protein